MRAEEMCEIRPLQAVFSSASSPALASWRAMGQRQREQATRETKRERQPRTGGVGEPESGWGLRSIARWGSELRARHSWSRGGASGPLPRLSAHACRKGWARCGCCGSRLGTLGFGGGRDRSPAWGLGARTVCLSTISGRLDASKMPRTNCSGDPSARLELSSAINHRFMPLRSSCFSTTPHSASKGASCSRKVRSCRTRKSWPCSAPERAETRLEPASSERVHSSTAS
jgi:hypothetical protein